MSGHYGYAILVHLFSQEQHINTSPDDKYSVSLSIAAPKIKKINEKTPD